MRRLAASVGAGVMAAIATGFLFWLVNRTVQINNVGWLRRQGGVVGEPWAWAAGGFVLGFLGYWLRAASRAHARAAREVGAEEGWKYSESFTLPPGAEAMPAFTGWSNGQHAMSGTADGVPVHVFDCTTIIKGDESDAVTDRTIALVPAENLPAFDLRPRTLRNRVLQAVGFAGLTFDPAGADPAEADTVRRFNELFQVWVGDPLELLKTLADGEPPVRAEREAAVRRLFTPAVMAAVCEYRDCAAESAAGYLAVWRGSNVRPPRTRPALRDAAVALRGIWTRSPREGSAAVIPARPNSGIGGQGRRMRNTVLGTFAGLFGGFVVAAVVMPILFFNGINNGGPGLGFFLQPVVFFGCILAGGVLGAAVGSRIPVRDTPIVPPADPEVAKRRGRAMVIGGLAGMFTGFFGGFVLAAGSQVVLGWKFDNFGIVAAIFFGSLFGGAGLGAVLGTMLGWRMVRRQTQPVD